MQEIIAYEMVFDKILSIRMVYFVFLFKKNTGMNIWKYIMNVFLYLQNGVIVGAVSCYGNELDDLIVEKSFQGQGIGQKLLLWGMNHIKEQGYEGIIFMRRIQYGAI